MSSNSKSKDSKPHRRSRKRKLRHTVQYSDNSDSGKADVPSININSGSKQATDPSLEEPSPKKEISKEKDDFEPRARVKSLTEELVTDNFNEHQNKASPSEPTQGTAYSLSDATAEETFKNLYLRKVTEELAEDLDKVRSAGDFSERSLPILIEALQQGIGTFSKEERIRIGRIAATSNGS